MERNERNGHWVNGKWNLNGGETEPCNADYGEGDVDEISDALQECMALEESPPDVLTWLDNRAPTAYFDRFVTLKEVFLD